MTRPSMMTTDETKRGTRVSRVRPAALLALAGALAAGACVNTETTTPGPGTEPARASAQAGDPRPAPRSGDGSSPDRPLRVSRLQPGDADIVDTTTGGNPTVPGAVVVPGPASAVAARQTVSAGSSMSARLDTTLDSSTANVGDVVKATLTSDVRGTTGGIALPVGTVLSGRVTDVQPARKVKKMAGIAFRFDLATLPDGTTAAISAGEGVDGRGWTKKQGAIIGGSAAGGAVLGQVVGGDTQSTIAGAVLGGAIATGVIMSHKGEDVVISSGSTMNLTLDGDVLVGPPAAS